MSNKEFFRRLFQLFAKYFFRGLLIILPVVATILVVIWLFNTLNSYLQIGHIPGLGILLSVVIVTIIGFLASGIFIKQILNLFDEFFERTPGIKVVYSTVKDFLGAFVGEKKKFTEPVLVPFTETGILRIGFITRKDLREFGLSEHVGVYLPDSYGFTGVFVLVPKDKVRPMDNINSGDLMKFVLTGGVTELDKREE